MDGLDAAAFADCHGGPGLPCPTGCGPADFDRDGDVDCTDHDRFAGAWTAPGTAPPLPACSITTITLTGTVLSWTAIDGANRYDVVQGDLAVLLQTGGDFTLSVDRCVANDVAATSLSDGAVAEAGGGFWFLFRGVKPGGNLTYDCLCDAQVDSRDPGINAAGGTCP